MVLRAAIVVQVRRTRFGLADPVGIDLRRNRKPDVGEGAQHLGGAVLASVFVAGDQYTPDLAVVGPLAGLVQVSRASVESSITSLVIEDWSPSQMGVARTTMSAGSISSRYRSGKSSTSQPCLRMSG